MLSTSARIALCPVLALAAAAAVGCNTNQPDRTMKSSQSNSPPAQKAQADVKEAKTMRGHGEQLKAQGDETGGERLIEQARVKEAEGKTKLEKAGQPQTKPE